MNNLKITTALLLLIAFAATCRGIDLTKWQYRTEVAFGEDADEYCKLQLTNDIYDKARRDLADIRLIDGQVQRPYLLIKPKDTLEKHRYPITTLNRSNDAEGNSLITLDFGEQLIKNSVRVVTEGKSFRRSVKVEGSNDDVKFFAVIKSAYVFAIGDKDDSRFDTIDLPDNDYRYLRITVEPMSTETESPTIKAVEAFRCGRKLALRQPVEVTYVSLEEDEEKNQSIYEYDLGFKNLPISEVILDIGDKSFYRCVTVAGRNSAMRTVKIRSEDNRERFKEVEVPWTNMGSRTIYRYTAADGENREKVKLSVSSPAYRYLRITINNYDDRPLDVRSATAEMIPAELIFPSEGNISTMLYVGAESETAPKYDIARRLAEPAKTKTSPAIAASLTENPDFGKGEQKPVAWTEEHKMSLLAALGIIVAITGVFMLKSFKSIQAEQGGQS